MTTDLTSRLAAIIQELTAPQVVEVKAARYVRVALAVQLTGYSDEAICRTMEDGVWREGAVWLRSASGEILIDMEGYEKWCKGK